MCKPASCPICLKTTWMGCGRHITEALSGLTRDQICTCAHADGVVRDYPPKAGTGVQSGN